jgi:PPM family protein phosphatase
VSGTIPQTISGPADGKNFEYSWDGNCLAAHLLSDVGKKRTNNEDSCIVCQPEDEALLAERGILFAVADGMGGASAGEHASHLALQVLVEAYYSGGFSDIPQTLEEALNAANIQVYNESLDHPEYAGMGTTVSAVAIAGDLAYLAQVGDSRVYLLRSGTSFHQLTRDHSLVAEQVRNGLISEAEAENHAMRNLITRAVGIKRKVKVDSFVVRLRKGDSLLICSDGLCGMIPDEEIEQSLISDDISYANHRLIARALEAGGNDNITSIILRVFDTPPRTEIQEGAEEITFPGRGIFSRFRKLFQ